MKIKCMRYYVVLLVLILINCKSKKQQQIKEPVPSKAISYNEHLLNHVKTLKTFNDTVLLGFVLGSSKAEAEKHLKSLIKRGKTKRKQAVRFSALGYTTQLEGHPYTIYIGDTEIPGLFILKYLDNKLFGVDLQLYKNVNSSSLKDFLSEKYGENIGEVESDGNFKYMWVRNNTEIRLEGKEWADIQYFDIRRKLNLGNELTGLDSLKKNIQKELSKEAKKDL